MHPIFETILKQHNIMPHTKNYPVIEQIENDAQQWWAAKMGTEFPQSFFNHVYESIISHEVDQQVIKDSIANLQKLLK